MKRGYVVLALLIILVTHNSFAVDNGFREREQVNLSGVTDQVINQASELSRDVGDTLYFGGDDGNGIAYVGGTWDFDTIVTDPYQGWTSFDNTANPGDYFSRVTAADFADDPCAPMILGTTGQLWVGIHEDEANLRDFVGGMGYQSNMCQKAFSPMFDYAGESIDIEFIYFNDTEPDYDYTFVYVSCFDAGGDPLEAEDAEYQVDLFTGIIGEAGLPSTYLGHVNGGHLPLATAKVKLQLRMWADGGYDDQDGSWDSACGPFAADDITFTVGATAEYYDFDIDEEGWTFSRCEGIGTLMGICVPATYESWLDEVGLLCDCALNGNALEMVDEENSPFSPPGHPRGHDEQLISGTIGRGAYQPPEWNTALVNWTAYAFLTGDRGTDYRPGYKYYPFTTEVNPVSHWSPRRGQSVWRYIGEDPTCVTNQYNFNTLNGNAGDPLPADWDSLQFVYEIFCSCAAFGDPQIPDEGNTMGSPVIDDIQVMLTGAADAPIIVMNLNGDYYQDGFGQNFPAYLEPSDRGNSNVFGDLSGPNDLDENDWLRDTTAVSGPTVTSDPLTQWDAHLFFKITRVGPRQHMVPEYHNWKARLTGDPEIDFVSVLMDSLETNQGVVTNKYVSYFHEDDPGFMGPSDYNDINEILPDGVFTPGTRVEYYFSSTWTNVPDSGAFILPINHQEFEILPGMRASNDSDYAVEWPSFLYVDAFNNGVEYYVNPTLNQLGIEIDKYDYFGASSNYKTPLKRSFCPGGAYNPGGYGNNGCTVEQLLGYRMIFVNTGTFGVGAMERADWSLFDNWLSSTDCDLPSIRRGVIFDGDEIASVMLQVDHQPEGGNFLNQVMGTSQVAPVYREYVEDWEYCVSISGAGAAFDPGDDVALYGNGCPNTYNYNVLGVQGGVTGAVGNSMYYNPDVGETEFGQVVRSNLDYPYNWRSVVNGYSIHHLSWAGCSGDACSSDSVCVVNAAAFTLQPALDWILDGADPLDPWLYPCNDTAVDEDAEVHSTLAINHLRGASPNPFRNTATIRFNLAEPGAVDFTIYDVSGRVVKSLGSTEFEAGENSIVWDGSDKTGNPVGGGIFWTQMATKDGFSSSKKMIVLR
jgi:flagellar hook capping protein FlgD